jgi:sigma-E factor negative regulatory protein RseA
MDERLKESLSALMDDEANELEVERLLSRVADDRELRQTWTRYHAARALASGQSVAYLDMDISMRVSGALADDAADAGDLSLRERWWRPVASFAVAASVAAVVVAGGQQLSQMGNEQVPALAAPVGIGNIAGATPVRASYGTQALPQLQPASHTAYRELARQRMQRYIQEHAEHAALNSPQGLIPFARVPTISE